MNSSFPLLPAASSSIALLRDGRYAQLQKAISGQQDAFERGEGRASDLQQVFTQFDQPDPALGEKLGPWLEACPGSYAAHTALATWLLSRAWAMRGSSTMNLVSDQGRRGMHHFLEQAEACALHAVTLTANPLHAWLVVASVHNTRGCRLALAEVEAEQYPNWYTEPLGSNPASLELRRAMLLHLRAEWGGSETHMLAFVRQQQEAALLSQTDLQKLWAEFHARVAHHAWLFLHESDKALERAHLAADLDDRHTELLFGFLSGEQRPLAERRGAMERYLTFAEREVQQRPLGLSYAQGGWLRSPDLVPSVSERLGRLLSAMADAGEPDAAWLLGALALEMPQLHWPNPLPPLLRARAEGDLACAELVVAVEKARNPGQEGVIREHILKAADLGSGEMSWRVYHWFPEFQQQFDLDERARYRYLLRAADAGDNNARFALAQQLRAGRVEVGEDGVLRPVNSPPLQDSLDYAKHLLERAAAEGHKGAEKILRNSKDAAWNSKTARRIRAGSSLRPAGGGAISKRPALEGFRFPWFLAVALIVGGVRACSSHVSTPSLDAQQQRRQILEQMLEDQQRDTTSNAKPAGGVQPVLPPGQNSKTP
jgi:hypothetical protein